jgi:phosphoribosylformylglycinamidine (FGAM) synthase-like enzyme
VLQAAAHDGLASAAHDLSDGGLSQALVESCLRGRCGARVTLPEGLDPFVALFSESSARAVVSVAPEHMLAFAGLASAHGVAVTELGVAGGPSLVFAGLFEVALDELAAAAAGTFPALFG